MTYSLSLTKSSPAFLAEETPPFSLLRSSINENLFEYSSMIFLELSVLPSFTHITLSEHSSSLFCSTILSKQLESKFSILYAGIITVKS